MAHNVLKPRIGRGNPAAHRLEDAMQNVSTEIKGTKLVITVDLAQKGTPSASGKTSVIGTTRGNARITGPNGEVFLGLNVYQYAGK